MNEIQIFQNQEFGAIRTMSNEQGEVMFCGKDVCDALGYSNGRDAVRKHVDGDDKTTVAICDGGSNYKLQATFINESGLYSLILSSKLESARRFKHWVTSEVLPSIRSREAIWWLVRMKPTRKSWLVHSKSCKPRCKDATSR